MWLIKDDDAPLVAAEVYCVAQNLTALELHMLSTMP
jgi:hypothetical protein